MTTKYNRTPPHPHTNTQMLYYLNIPQSVFQTRVTVTTFAAVHPPPHFFLFFFSFFSGFVVCLPTVPFKAEVIFISVALLFYPSALVTYIQRLACGTTPSPQSPDRLLTAARLSSSMDSTKPEEPETSTTAAAVHSEQTSS